MNQSECWNCEEEIKPDWIYCPNCTNPVDPDHVLNELLEAKRTEQNIVENATELVVEGMRNVYSNEELLQIIEDE